MTHAIQCRREDLTPAELDALTGLFTRPRPDMAFSFDDLQDAKKMQSTTGGGIYRNVTAEVQVDAFTPRGL